MTNDNVYDDNIKKLINNVIFKETCNSNKRDNFCLNNKMNNQRKAEDGERILNEKFFKHI